MILDVHCDLMFAKIYCWDNGSLVLDVRDDEEQSGATGGDSDLNTFPRLTAQDRHKPMKV